MENPGTQQALKNTGQAKWPHIAVLLEILSLLKNNTHSAFPFLSALTSAQRDGDKVQCSWKMDIAKDSRL